MALFGSQGRSRQPPERTAQERELARQERARRRALADGALLEESPAEAGFQNGGTWQHREMERPADSEPPPDPQDPPEAEQVPEPPQPPQPELPPEPAPPSEPEQPPEPELPPDPAPPSEPEPPAAPDVPVEPPAPSEPEVPLAPSADRARRLQEAGRALREMPHVPHLRRRRAERAREHARRKARERTPGGRRLAGRIVAIGALLVAAALVWFLVELFQPFHGEGSGRVAVTIPKGAGASEIGSILARDGVVSSSLLFKIRVLLAGKRGDLHSGRFVLRHEMSYSAAMSALGREAPVHVVRVAVPEGYTRAQIAALAGADGLRGSYLAASKPSRAFSPASYGAPAGISTLEGFLFPDTYELTAGASAARLVGEQLAAFRRHFGAAQAHRAHALGITPYELLIVASMIEREALLARDRPLIASVIYNRLRLGMPLGIDATIRYALKDFAHPLTESELKINSPYNTRLRRGLPPTPIGNPGMASIEAAAHPARTRDLYYVAGADGCGELVFSSSYAQFERASQAYQEALRRNGGNVPSCHH